MSGLKASTLLCIAIVCRRHLSWTHDARQFSAVNVRWAERWASTANLWQVEQFTVVIGATVGYHFWVRIKTNKLRCRRLVVVVICAEIAVIFQSPSVQTPIRAGNHHNAWTPCSTDGTRWVTVAYFASKEVFPTSVVNFIFCTVHKSAPLLCVVELIPQRRLGQTQVVWSSTGMSVVWSRSKTGVNQLCPVGRTLGFSPSCVRGTNGSSVLIWNYTQ